MSLMIEAKGLTKQYGPKAAISDVSFEIRRGEVVGFVGPNGAGKTTTMKILTCFIAPTAGTAKVNGADVFTDSLAVRQAIGYLPESTPLYTEMLVLEYLQFAARMRGLKGEQATARIKKVAEQTSLGDVVGKEIRTLSKGFKQRVGIAQALIHEPPVVILDEPMSGLDPNQMSEIRDLIVSIGKERTVMLSTHNLAEVQVSCTRVLVISGGKIVADDKPDALVSRSGKSFFIVDVQVAEGNGQREAGVTAARDALRRVDGVDRIKDGEAESPKEHRFEIYPATDKDLRESLFRAAVQNNLTLVGLRREGENLEHVFRDLTLGERKDDKNKTKDAPAAA